MDVLLIASMIVGLWAFFAIVGNERQRRIEKFDFERLQAQRLAEAQAMKAAEIPTLG